MNGVSYLSAALCLLLLAGCATVSHEHSGEINRDPLEPTNRSLYNLNESLDMYIFKPVAQGYVNTFPLPVRRSVTRFFDNASYLNVIINSFLQGKFENGFSDIGRFVINSSIGVGGLFDVASQIGLPEHNEDTGQTLAVWGMGEGAYLFLPGTGSNSTRDVSNMVTSTLLFPFTYLSYTILLPVTALAAINARANMLSASGIRDTAAIDPYAFTREAYLQKRQHMIEDGEPTENIDDDVFFED